MAKMTANELRRRYVEFFEARGHVEVPPVPLVPENDPTTLFTSSGMQPLVPYLLGEPHPSGKRLVNSQPSVRVQDIDEVGDNRHTTFFEMLGNWSLGDYFKKEQLRWFWEFLTKEAGLDPEKLYVSVFAGSPKHNIPKDKDSVKMWKEIYKEVGIEAKEVELLTEERGGKLGMQGGRIFAYDAKKNWWARVLNPDEMPAGEPGGPDSEVFYEFTEIEHDTEYGENCHPNCDCGRFLEIGNSVFMEYVKQKDGSFRPLPAKNVDFGGGFERILAAINDNPDVFETGLFGPIVKEMEKASGLKYEDNQPAFRIVADHMKAAAVMISQGLEPSNKQQGYVLRRLLRRALYKLETLSLPIEDISGPIVAAIKNIYGDSYLADADVDAIDSVIRTEADKFSKTLRKGMAFFDKQEMITGKVAFDLWQTYGFPYELTEELVEEKGGRLSKEEFLEEFQVHQEKSRTASAGMFKGGLVNHSENVVKYHTATHLLHAALRQVLGDTAQQKGSNITGERLRFDFSYGRKLEEREIKKIEELINQQIEADLQVSCKETTYDEAITDGALAFFGDKYPEKVKVYSMGEGENLFSKEICGGPHIEHTGEIGKIEIYKETSAGAGLRRVYARMRE